MNKEAILEGFKCNNQDIITETYKKYRNEFIGFTYKKYNLQSEDSKEVYQEAFSIMYKNIVDGSLVKFTSDVKTYLFQIGRNIINNMFKRGSRYEDTFEINLTRQKDEMGDGNDYIKEERMKMIVKECIAELNQTCIQLLTYYYFRGYTYEELMETLDYKNVDSLKTQKYKCFKKLESVVKTRYKAENVF
ncbi:MAG: sigma-70 family RNA polymerase sigma factor [Bacteroidales bacterium]|nr:sigma-70 family RNA polymerase sigma factor [Bacteroidales bacterium]